MVDEKPAVKKELSLQELQARAKEVEQERMSKSEQPKTPRLGIGDLNKLCTIKRSFDLPSTVAGHKRPTYQFVILEMTEDKTERAKSLNSWDMQAVASGATSFKVGSVEHKGSIKLVLLNVDPTKVETPVVTPQPEKVTPSKTDGKTPFV